jgi:hypothetical protein
MLKPQMAVESAQGYALSTFGADNFDLSHDVVLLLPSSEYGVDCPNIPTGAESWFVLTPFPDAGTVADHAD